MLVSYIDASLVIVTSISFINLLYCLHSLYCLHPLYCYHPFLLLPTTRVKHVQFSYKCVIAGLPNNHNFKVKVLGLKILKEYQSHCLLLQVTKTKQIYIY